MICTGSSRAGEEVALNVEAQGSGSVARVPEADRYEVGQTVELRAVPARWYAFSHWGDGDHQNPRQVVVTTNAETYVAVFTNTVPVERSSFKLLSWEMGYGGVGTEVFEHVLPAPDGGWILAGPSDSPRGSGKESETQGELDYWVMKVGAAGSREWERSLGGQGRDQLTWAGAGGDGGVLLLGFSDSDQSGTKTEAGFGREDLWLVKLDALGGDQWQRVLGGAGVEEFPVAWATSDGGMILGAYSDSGPGGNKTSGAFGGVDYWVVKLGAAGQTEWERTFGGSEDDFISLVRPTADGGYVIAGTSRSGVSGSKTNAGFGGFDFWVVRVNGLGDPVWQQSYGGPGDDILTGLALTPDGGYVLAGYSDSAAGGSKTTPGYGGYDYWVLKVDPHGTVSQEHTLGGGGMDVLTQVRELRDGGALLGGYTESGIGPGKNSENHGGLDWWAVKVGSGGLLEWERTLGGLSDEVPLTAIELMDGGVAMAGLSESPRGPGKWTERFGESDYWIVKLDEQGAKEWEEVLGGSRAEAAYALAEREPGELLVAGTSSSWRGGNRHSPAYGAYDGWAALLTSPEVQRGSPAVVVNGEYVPWGQADVPVAAEVRIGTSLPGGLIYYTLDGSEPGTNALAYVSPLVITQSVTLRTLTLSTNGLSRVEGDPIRVSVLPTYVLTTSTAGGGRVVVEPQQGPYMSNTVVELTATRESGWTFLRWRGDFSQTNETVELTMNSDKSAEAVFGRPLSVRSVGKGTVTCTPQLELYEAGQTVALTAVPARWYAFSHWSDGDLANPRSVVVGTNRVGYSAIFTNTVPLEQTRYKRVEWDQAFGGTGTDGFEFILAGPGGTWVLGGESASAEGPGKGSPGYGAADYWVMEIGAEGERSWERSLGGAGQDHLRFLDRSADGSLFLLGTSDSPAGGTKLQGNFGQEDLWALKLDAAGNELWQTVLGGVGTERAPVGLLTGDGGLLVGAASDSAAGGNKTAAGYGGLDYWVVKLAGDGHPEWERSYGGTADDAIRVIRGSGDGGFWLAGTSAVGAGGNKTAAGHGATDFWVVRVDGNGQMLWDRSFGGSEEDVLTGLEPTGDGGCLIAGYSGSGVSGNKSAAGQGGYDYWLLRLNAAGEVIWEKAFGGTGADVLTALNATSTGSYILSGYSESAAGGNKQSPGYGGRDCWLLSVGVDGIPEWEQSLGGAGDEVPSAVRETADGGLVVAGRSSSDRSGTKVTSRLGAEDGWIVKLGPGANLQWDQALGGSRDDRAWGLGESTDGDLLVVGSSSSRRGGTRTSAAYGTNDGWAVRLGSLEMPAGAPLARINGNFVPEGSVSVANEADVRLWTSDAAAVVQYTLDGSEPGTNSATYTDPISMLESGTLRALASGGGLGPGVAGDPIEVRVLPTYALTAVAGPGGGLVTDPSEGPSMSNTVVELTAEPEAGWSFVEWRGDLAGTNAVAELRMDSVKSVQAVFGRPLVVEVAGQGGVTRQPDVPLYPYGSTVELRAEPAPGFLLERWVVGGQSLPAADWITVTLTNAFTTFEAHFLPAYAVQATTAGGGQLTLDPPGGPYLSNAVVQLRAEAHPGWTFLEWRGDLAGTNSTQGLQLDAEKRVEAVFGRPLAIDVVGSGLVTRAPDQEFYAFGAEVRLQATPAPGFYLDRWEMDGVPRLPAPELVLRVTNAPTAVAAHFLPLYELQAGTAGGGLIMVDPPTSPYPTNTLVRLVAVARAGWSFLGWRGDLGGDEVIVHLRMDAAKTVEGLFGTPVIVRSSGSGTVHQTPDLPFQAFDSRVRIEARPVPGHYLDHWVVGGVIRPPDNPIEVVVTNALIQVEARFEAQAMLSTTVEGSGTVAVTPLQTFYSQGQAAMLTALPDPGWVFTGWSGNASGNLNPLSFTVQGTNAVTARFMPERLITSAGWSANRGFALTFVGRIGAGYEVETTTNLVDWLSLLSVTNTEPLTVIAEPTPYAGGWRFYRIRRVE